MGYGAYSHAAHMAMTDARKHKRGAEVFTQRSVHPSMDPQGLRFRESRDSEDHPESIAIIFAFDVSGSMGDIPRRLATETLPGFMQALLDAGVRDPQVLFAAVNQIRSGTAPLQVGQFESTASLMDRWLTTIYLEGGGGGGDENYELMMYVAARHTSVDCLEKRRHKGYLFITGDEDPNRAVEAWAVRKLIGDKIKDIPLTDMIEETLRGWELFFLTPWDNDITKKWEALLGERLVRVLGGADDIGHVAAGLVALTEGASLDDVLGRLGGAGAGEAQITRVRLALKGWARHLGRG